MTECPHCSEADATLHSQLFVGVFYTSLFQCPRCGDFYIVDEAILELRKRDDCHLLSGLAREKHDRAHTQQGHQIQAGDLLTIREFFAADLNSLFAQVPSESDIPTKVHKLLAAIARASQPGDDVSIHPNNDYPLGYARNERELRLLINLAVENGWLTMSGDSTSMSCCLTSSGWVEIRGEV